MAASITNHGMMTALTSQQSPVGVTDGNALKVGFSSQPRGVLTITNLNTAYTKMVTLSAVSNGEVVYSTSDDAGYSSGHAFDITCSGKADGLYLSRVLFDGNGSSEVSGAAGGEIFTGA